MISTHEMEAMNPTSPKDRFKQLIVVSFFGIAMLSYSCYDAGIFNPITITEEKLSIGNGKFVYKTLARDYLTSTGSMRSLSDDLLLSEYDFHKNKIYSILLDNVPKLIPTSYTRIIVGTFLDDEDTSKKKEEEEGNTLRMMLLSKNNNDDETTTNIYTEFKEDDDERDDRSRRFWDSLNYQIGILPSTTNVAVIKFRFTNGFFSSLIHFYKVIPALVKYMQEKDVVDPIIIYSCNTSDLMCTFYAPFDNISQFHLNELDTKQYKLKLMNEKKIKEKDGSTTVEETSSSEEEVTNNSEL